MTLLLLEAGDAFSSWGIGTVLQNTGTRSGVASPVGISANGVVPGHTTSLAETFVLDDDDESLGNGSGSGSDSDGPDAPIDFYSDDELE